MIDTACLRLSRSLDTNCVKLFLPLYALDALFLSISCLTCLSFRCCGCRRRRRGMIRVMRTQSEKDSREEILKAFRLFDDDETGKISFRNLKRVAKELGENMTDEELQVGLRFLCHFPHESVTRRWSRWNTGTGNTITVTGQYSGKYGTPVTLSVDTSGTLKFSVFSTIGTPAYHATDVFFFQFLRAIRILYVYIC